MAYILLAVPTYCNSSPFMLLTEGQHRTQRGDPDQIQNISLHSSIVSADFPYLQLAVYLVRLLLPLFHRTYKQGSACLDADLRNLRVHVLCRYCHRHGLADRLYYCLHECGKSKFGSHSGYVCISFNI